MEVSDAVLAQLAETVAGALPLIAARVPATPAAELGRLRTTADDDPWPTHGTAVLHRPARPHVARRQAIPDSPVRDALGSLPQLLVERLLGALELTVPELDLAGAPDLTGCLGELPAGGHAFVTMASQSEAVAGAAVLDQIRPGAVPLVAELTGRLAAHPRVAPLLAAAAEATDEQGIAAAHGAHHLALAVATAAAVLRRLGIGEWATRPPAVLGVAIGTAVLRLREAPMPAGYAVAIIARARAEYLMPRRSSGVAPVSGYRFALLEDAGGWPAPTSPMGSERARTRVPEVDFAGNGLVTVVEGGAVIRTGVESGHVRVMLTILEGPPPDVATGWDEIVEVSWRAAVGGASVVGPGAGAPDLRRATPPWPGDYRLRVHARGRDDAEEPDTQEPETEYYELAVWRAPAAPEIGYARTDRLGHRLRGEPEPERVEPPEAGYRWLRHSILDQAATVTVVTGADVADVLRAFGADPARPESMRDIDDDLTSWGSIDPWVAVRDVGGAVLAVEYNGWQGSTAPVLTRASAGGRAASMYWNVNALTRLSFAEHGTVLVSFEPFGDIDAPPAVAETLTGLDFADHFRRKSMMGLVAVQRFTGYGITADDLAAIAAADIGFRIVPDPPLP